MEDTSTRIENFRDSLYLSSVIYSRSFSNTSATTNTSINKLNKG